MELTTSIQVLMTEIFAYYCFGFEAARLEAARPPPQGKYILMRYNIAI